MVPVKESGRVSPAALDEPLVEAGLVQRPLRVRGDLGGHEDVDGVGPHGVHDLVGSALPNERLTAMTVRSRGASGDVRANSPGSAMVAATTTRHRHGQQHPPPPQQGRRDERAASRPIDDERAARLQHDDEVCRRVEPAQRAGGDEATSARRRSRRRPGDAPLTRLGHRSGLQHDRDDHRAATDLAADPRADGAPDDLLELLVVADAIGDGLLDGPLDLGDDLLEDLLVLDEARAP